MSSLNKPFRAIIVGGGPSGLALAQCLNAAGIDFVLLERRAVIVEPSGAGLGVWPNCARLLDQLGLFEKAIKLCKPMTTLTSYNPNGSLLKKIPFYTFMGKKYRHVLECWTNAPLMRMQVWISFFGVRQA
jgi:2-polyprenyl-6-methoxyphenol hydroxylase-like FAD-dependent oxidoreductase